MRMNPSYNRVANLLTSPEVPRFSGGGIALCHWCQREVYWSNGFLNALIKKVKNAASFGYSSRNSGGNKTYDQKNALWDGIIKCVGSGLSINDTCLKMKCEATTVYEVLRVHNIPTPTQLRKEKNKTEFIDIFGPSRAKKVVEMRMGGQKWNTIAAIMGEKRETVMSAYINMTGEL